MNILDLNNTKRTKEIIKELSPNMAEQEVTDGCLRQYRQSLECIYVKGSLLLTND